jgi:excisionase family DNA binding protein
MTNRLPPPSLEEAKFTSGAPAMTTTDDELLTPQELAALLKLPLGTIRKQRAEGTGPPGFRVGKHVRWRRGDVMEWLEKQQEKDLHR